MDDDELNTVIMQMIGELNASHTGVSGGGPANGNRAFSNAPPGVRSGGGQSGFYKVAHIYKEGPADHDYLKPKKGDYFISVINGDREDHRQLLEVLPPLGRPEVPLPRQRQAGQRAPGR